MIKEQREKSDISEESETPETLESLENDDDFDESERREFDDKSITKSASLRRNLIIGVVTVLALLAIFYYFFWRNSAVKTETEEGKSDAEIVVSVKTTKVERDSLSQDFSAVGTIFPVQQATVSATLNAPIKRMSLLKNNFVRKGDVVAVLNTQDLESQRAEAQLVLQEANLNAQTVTKVTAPQANAQAEKDAADAKATVDNARILYERRKDLYDKGGIALKDLEATQLALVNAENNLKLVQKSSNIRINAANPNDKAIAQSRITQSQNKIKTLENQISLATIRAPLSGFVTEQAQFQGEFATQGAKLLTIADIGEIIVKANFADTVATNLKNGDAVTVLPNDLAGERMSGKVTLVSRTSDATNRTVEVWVNLGNGAGKLRPGGAAQVIIATNETSDAIIIPSSAVTLDASNADEGTVMVVGFDNIARETKVKIGIRKNDKTQILQGLNGNEQVIIEGNYSLPDGTKVEISDSGDDAKSDEK